jgi:hypothetical protein
MTDTTDPIAELAELAATVLDDYRPMEDLRPVVEAVLAEASAQQWIAKQLAETGLKSMDFRNGMTMELEPAQEMVAMWVGAARAMLGDAPNYSETSASFPADADRPGGKYEMEVKVAESLERYVFILQRVGPGTLTPHEARQHAETERDDALRIVAQWCVQTANGPENTNPHNLAADLMFRLEQAGHTLPEVVWP